MLEWFKSLLTLSIKMFNEELASEIAELVEQVKQYKQDILLFQDDFQRYVLEKDGKIHCYSGSTPLTKPGDDAEKWLKGRYEFELKKIQSNLERVIRSKQYQSSQLTLS